VALELAALALGAAFFLAPVPEWPIFVDLGLALLALGLVALTAAVSQLTVALTSRFEDDPGRQDNYGGNHEMSRLSRRVKRS